MTYLEVIQCLNSLIDYERLSKYSYKRSFILKRFQDFLQEIHNPQDKLSVIHVAGTKGKGSVCAFIAHILKKAGFKVGLYTSPHLNDHRERIRILDERKEVKGGKSELEGMVSKREVAHLFLELKPSIEKFNKNSKRGNLTFFEVCTALALQYFMNEKVDFVILETGLGGRLDATNACSSLLSIITPISYEHTWLLGGKLKEIAYEKASIIKKENKSTEDSKILALTSRQPKSVMGVIERISKERNAILLREGRDFKFSIKENNSFDYSSPNYKINNLKVNLLGRHQISNACLAIAGVKTLRRQSIDAKAIKMGLKDCIWPARFEVVSKKPLVVVDGAQNVASVEALRKTVKKEFVNKKIWIIFGILKDKELRDTCHAIGKISNNIILTKIDTARASNPKDLTKYFRRNSVILTGSTREALAVARSKTKKDDLILVTGSLYLCGEIKRIINL